MIPSADAMAHAFIAASERTGEDPLKVFRDERSRRCQLAVLEALGHVFPELDWPARGRLSGLRVGHPQNSLMVAQRRQWWDSDGAVAAGPGDRA